VRLELPPVLEKSPDRQLPRGMMATFDDAERAVSEPPHVSEDSAARSPSARLHIDPDTSIM